MRDATAIEDFLKELNKKSYKKLKETSNTIHFKKVVPSKHQEFHLIIRLNRQPMDFRLHKDNYLVLDKYDKPYKKTLTRLTDKSLLEEFKEIASILSKTNPDVSFTMPCPRCGCKIAYKKFAKHIERNGCSHGFGGFLNTLWKLDQAAFNNEDSIRKYYTAKYGIESRTELSTEQIKEEIELRKSGLKNTAK